MALQSEQVAHQQLVGGAQTTLHSHPGGGGGAEVKAGNITTSGGSATVTFSTAFPDTSYAIALAATETSDTTIANWYSKTAGGFSVRTENDKGGSVDVEVLWIATPYADP